MVEPETNWTAFAPLPVVKVRSESEEKLKKLQQEIAEAEAMGPAQVWLRDGVAALNCAPPFYPVL